LIIWVIDNEHNDLTQQKRYCGTKLCNKGRLQIMDTTIFHGEVSGIDEITAPLLLPEGIVSEMINLHLDRSGESGFPTRRGNWSNHSTTPFSVIDGVTSFVSDSDTQYYAIFSEGKIAVSEDGKGEWQTIAEGLEISAITGSLSLGMGSTLLHSGHDSVVISGEGVAAVTPLSIPQPEIAGGSPICAVHHDTGGEIGAGWYNYVLVYESETGDRSNPSQPFTAYKAAESGSTGFSGSTNRVEITNIPVPSDPRVKKKRLYRTKGVITSTLSPSPFIYYEVAVLSPGRTTFTDKTADADLSVRRFALFTSSPKGKCWCTAQGRLFSGSVKVPAVNFFAPPFSNDGVSTKIFRGTGFASGGSLGNASAYKYRLVYIDENGTTSAMIETPQIDTPGDNFELLAKIKLDYLPYLPSDEKLRITEKRLYRTKRNGSVFYRHPVELSFSLLSYEDTVADTALLSETFPASVEPRGYPASLVFSETGRHFTFPPENIISLPGGDEEEIMSIHEENDGVLILTQKAVYKLFTQGDPLTWRLITLIEGVGQTLENGVLRVPYGVIFYSGGAVYRFQKGELQNIGEGVAKTLSLVQRFWSPARFSVLRWCGFPVKLINNSRLLLIFDEKNGAWYKFTHPGLAGVASSGGTDERLLTYAGGNILKYSHQGEGPDVIGELDSDIEVKLITREYAAAGFIWQRLRKLRLYLKTLSGGVTVKLRTTAGEIVFSHTFTEAKEVLRINPIESADGMKAICRTVSIEITGTGLKTLQGIKLEKRSLRN